MLCKQEYIYIHIGMCTLYIQCAYIYIYICIPIFIDSELYISNAS